MTESNADEKTTEVEVTDTGEPQVITASEEASADTSAEADDTETSPASEASADAAPLAESGSGAAKIIAFAVLPVLALVLAAGAAWLKFYDNQAVASNAAREQSMRAAMDSTAVLLSYKPDTVEQQLTDARKLLTGQFSGQYEDLITNVVIPNAKQQMVSAVATVPKAASVSAEPDHAVVLVFVNQTVVVGTNPPSDTASSVRVSLDKVDGAWLISKFDPV